MFFADFFCYPDPLGQNETDPSSQILDLLETLTPVVKLRLKTGRIMKDITIVLHYCPFLFLKLIVNGGKEGILLPQTLPSSLFPT